MIATDSTPSVRRTAGASSAPSSDSSCRWPARLPHGFHGHLRRDLQLRAERGHDRHHHQRTHEYSTHIHLGLIDQLESGNGKRLSINRPISAPYVPYCTDTPPDCAIVVTSAELNTQFYRKGCTPCPRRPPQGQINDSAHYSHAAVDSCFSRAFFGDLTVRFENTYDKHDRHD